MGGRGTTEECGGLLPFIPPGSYLNAMEHSIEELINTVHAFHSPFLNMQVTLLLRYHPWHYPQVLFRIPGAGHLSHNEKLKPQAYRNKKSRGLPDKNLFTNMSIVKDRYLCN